MCYCSLRGKQIYRVVPEVVGGADHVLAISDGVRSNSKVIAAFLFFKVIAYGNCPFYFGIGLFNIMLL